MLLFKRMTRAAVLALSLAALPTLAAAQQRPVPQRASQPSAVAPTRSAAARSAATRDAQAMYAELMQIGQRLQTAQARAMQDSQLRAAYEALGRDMKTAIERADPSLVGVEARARAMEAEARRAQQAGDQAKLARLMQDAQQIQVKLMNAQQRAIREQPALANRARSFEEQLRRKMIEVEPQTMTLLERGKNLQSRLVQQAAQAQQRPGAPRQ